MSTHLSRHFRSVRQSIHLCLGDLARLIGYINIARGANRIIAFEERGIVKPDLFIKLAAALGIDQQTISRLIEQDQLEYLQQRLSQEDESVQIISLWQRNAPLTFPPWKIPKFTSLEEATKFAGDYAKKQKAPVVAWINAKVRIWINEAGEVEQKPTPKLEGIWLPCADLPGGQRKFAIVSGLIEVVDAG